MLHIFHPKTCINCFPKENYIFTINELQKDCVCITYIDLNATIRGAGFRFTICLCCVCAELFQAVKFLPLLNAKGPCQFIWPWI